MRATERIPVLPAATFLALAWMLVVAAPASAEFGDRVLRPGMRGDDVATLQRKLTRLGIETDVDRRYGPATERSMRRYERRKDRRVNGVCSRADARSIKRDVRRRRARESEDGGTSGGATSGFGSRRLEPGDRGRDVTRLQRLLTEMRLPTPATGYYGRETKTNVEKWEAWRYLRADGEVPPNQARKIVELARNGARYVARSHVFPVRGPHDYGGAGSRFGAPRSGHTHQGQDIAAAQGTKLVAVHNGRVAYREYQAGGAGHYVVIHGKDRSDSVYMHLVRRAVVKPGERVRAGEKIGKVGSTGSSTGPHLHFELWTPHWFDGGNPYDPLPKLRRWDRRT